jgi:hypothetical protein
MISSHTPSTQRGQIRGVVEGEQEEDRHAPKPEDQDVGDDGLAPLQGRHRDVEEEHQADNHNPDLDDEGLFEKLTALVDLEQIPNHRDGGGAKKQPELQLGEKWAEEFVLGFLRDQIIGCSHEADQKPHDQSIGVDHSDDVEGKKLGKRIGQDIDRAGQDAEQDLRQEQAEGSIEIEQGHLLSLVFHRFNPDLIRLCLAASSGS